MKSKELEKNERRITEILAANAAELATLKASVARLEEESEEKEAKAIEQATAGDYAAWEKTKTEIAGNDAKRLMREERIKALTEEPLITEEDYNEIVEAIKREQNANAEEAIRVLIECSEKMQEKAYELEKLQIEANEFLKKLCNKVFRSYEKSYDFIRDKYTKRFVNYETIDHNDVITWGRRGVTDKSYKVYAGKDLLPTEEDIKNVYGEVPKGDKHTI